MPRSPFHLRRREFLQLLGGSLVLGGCTEIGGTAVTGSARLKARPATTTTTLPAGLMRDNHGADVVSYLPESARAKAQVPVFIFLHGAGRGVESFVDAFRPFCDTAGVMLLAPYAYSQTWDAITGAFDIDVTMLDAMLTWAFATVNVDPSRLTLAGFSDGATYGLSLGRANGDLFTRLVGFSPGYLINVDERSRPPIVISHGDQDPVLPFANTRDSIVPTLRSHGYTVDFIPFAGPHAVPLSVAGPEIARLGT